MTRRQLLHLSSVYQGERTCERRDFCPGLLINGRCPYCGWSEPKSYREALRPVIRTLLDRLEART